MESCRPTPVFAAGTLRRSRVPKPRTSRVGMLLRTSRCSRYAISACRHRFSFVDLRAGKRSIGNGLWKLPEPWTPRTRPPLLGTPPERVFHELPQVVLLVQKGTFLFR